MTAGQDKSVKLWNPNREAPDTGALLIKTYQGAHSKEISQVAVAEDGARFACPDPLVGADIEDATRLYAEPLQAAQQRRQSAL